MGHAFGLDHSRRFGSALDYQDPWDVMSTAAAYSAPDPDYGARGPGLNAWNMRSRRWLDDSRVWRKGGPFDEVVQLRPLHERDLPGWLAAELPPNDGGGGHGRFLVEFRVKDGWDAGIPRSAVLVHLFEGEIGQFLGTHSYIMAGTNGNMDLVAGDVFNGGSLGAIAEVKEINEFNRTATLRLIYSR